MLYARLVHKRFTMKRTLLIALSLFLSLSMAFSGGLVLESETPGFRIYGQTGRSMPDETVMDDAMYIILNEEEDAVLNSDFGTITLKPDTILGITSLDVEAPSFYLVSGYAEIDLKARMRVDLYTPTSSFAFNSPGTYGFISTESEEIALNYTGEGSIAYYDSILGRSGKVEKGYYVSALENTYGKIAEEEEEIKVPGKPELNVISSSLVKPLVPSVEVESSALVGEKDEEVVPSIPATPVLKVVESTLSVEEPETQTPPGVNVEVEETALVKAEEKEEFGREVNPILLPPVVTKIE